jgi:hypothetical protein
MSQTATEKGRFVQFPLHLIYGCENLTRDDKWVILAIMGECWTEGPYRLSYREISGLSGVPISLLSSYNDKKTGIRREGVMDRIERVTGYIHVNSGKDLSANGKPRGNTQSYITIDYARIWKENVAYCETKKQVNNVPQDYQPVSYANRCVSPANAPVLYANKPVSYANKPVSVSRSKVTTYISNTLLDKQEEKDISVVSAFAEHNPPIISSSDLPITKTNVVLQANPIIESSLTIDTEYHSQLSPNQASFSTSEVENSTSLQTVDVMPIPECIAVAPTSPYSAPCEVESSNSTSETDKPLVGLTPPVKKALSTKGIVEQTTFLPDTSNVIRMEDRKTTKKVTPMQHLFESYNQTLSDLFKKEIVAVENRTSKSELEALLKSGGTSELLRLVIVDMWNESTNGEYWWRNIKRMTLKAVCNQYATRAPGLKQTLETCQSPVTPQVTPKKLTRTPEQQARYEMAQRFAKIGAEQIRKEKELIAAKG